MPLLLIYLLKISISLAVVYTFYQLALRKLTFYSWNRFYLLAYTALAFFIPFINISPVLEQQHWEDSGVIQLIPSIGNDVIINNSVANDPVTTFNTWYLVGALLLSGMLLMLIRLLLQWISFRRMLMKAELLEDGPMKIYRVEGNMIPFSFGNSIFINPSLHSSPELQEIIRHEFVHVKQKHSFDIIWGEIICLLNWYNPFAWLLRRAIRQNLEFIADQKVLEHGVDRKQYQYLLLKVIGNDQFSIASKFNFSSLKKRITMMNKMRSAGLHLVKFLFILPLVAVLLLAFRNQQRADLAEKPLPMLRESLMAADFTDSVPPVTTMNSKGYYIDIKGVNGVCVVVVKDKNKKEVERVLLTEWNESEKYHQQFGEILPPPVAPVTPVAAVGPVGTVPPVPPVPAFIIRGSDCLPSTVTSVTPVATGSGKNYEANATPGVVYVGGTNIPGVTAVSPAPASASSGVNVIGPGSHIINGSEDIIITITSATTKEQLDVMIEQMKAKGVDLRFENMDFNDGKLISLSGTMKRKDSRSNFSVTDFQKLTLAMTEIDGKVYFKVSTKDQKIVI